MNHDHKDNHPNIIEVTIALSLIVICVILVLAA
ncbi:hypothetical protein OPIT5_28395 [Opitutaceae bacterium TAV5]|nr:hypothetical protein OPIT5_28395 [Opitutaceae bacterium TAV5]